MILSKISDKVFKKGCGSSRTNKRSILRHR
jgi:hypothetical protein